MAIRTNKEISGTLHGYPYTVPAGTRCTNKGAGGVTLHGYYFVDDLSFLPTGSIIRHDATHYGIRVESEDVTVD